MTWWQTAVIYQVYPRSFQDSNGDGIGDLAGIRQRLPYLRDLGVDAIWLSPIFVSPMKDFGYDISDYTGIDPIFGTVDDFDALLQAAHAIGLKLILDLVPNHTSDQHPWFKESRSSRTNPKRDWYIWRDGRDGGPPTNWLSEFGGGAWEYDNATGQYYYHAFLAAQPDLNWRNQEVRDAVYEVMRFWLRRGVDGFRVDVIWHLIKDEQFRDNPPNPDFKRGDPPPHALVPLYTTDRPEIHDVIAQMRRVMDEFPERLLIGEIYLPVERLVSYYGADLAGLHLPFNFTLLSAQWHARSVAKLIDEYEEALPLGGWPNWVLGNHDRPRVATRVGTEQARVAAMLLLTLRGTPTVYYGDEIGMEQVFIPAEALRDPLEGNIPGKALGRDGCRTPMQWDATRFAGFSTVDPWLPLSPNSAEVNVVAELNNDTSMLALHRHLIRLRHSCEALARGSYRPIMAEGDILLFVRETDQERMLIALNFGTEPMSVEFGTENVRGRIVVSTFLDRHHESVDHRLALRPNEGVVVARE